MSEPKQTYCEVHNVTWFAGNDCPDCINAALESKCARYEKAIKTAVEYLESTTAANGCMSGCDPSVNCHEPECSMLADFEQALADKGEGK